MSYVGVQARGHGNIPFTNNPLEVALYDNRGRLVDIMRSTGVDDVRVFNHPRSPAGWEDFVGGAARVSSRGGVSIIARQVGNDTDTGSDWRTTTQRSLGSANPIGGFIGSIGHDHALDVQLTSTGFGGGLSIIVNGGPTAAGLNWRVLFSSGHANGQGPIFGLSNEAITNYQLYWDQIGGILDSTGGARMEVDPNTFPPGVELDAVFWLLGPGGPERHTLVLEYDS